MSAGNQGITVTPGTPPTNPYCPASWTTIFADIINQATFQIDPAGGYFLQSTSPGNPGGGPKIWFQVSAAGSDAGALIRIYCWDNTAGKWLSQHPCPAIGSERRLWVGNTTDLQTYDGGDANAPSHFAGPMWAVDTNFAAKIPIGPGTLPVSGTVVAVTNTGGVDQVTLSNAQTPPHTHLYHPLRGHAAGNDTLTDEGVCFANTPPGQHPQGNIGTYDLVTDGPDNLISPGVQSPINLMNPYYGTYFIKRTSRIYYAV